MDPSARRARSRAERLERLASEPFDLLVIGAGIVGAGTAWAAARAGARVAVVDAGDAAGATSSASSKLVHGGLRYLRIGDVGLVREAHQERHWNAGIVAPHLVRPLRFVVPIGPDSPYSASLLRAGVFVYATLSRFRDGRAGKIARNEARSIAPGLRTDGRRTFVAYHDHRTDDARLVLAALRTAEDHGATWVNYARVEALRMAEGRVAGAEVTDQLDGSSFGIAARAVVNATGPWTDRLRGLEDPGAGTSIRLSKGAHLVLRTETPWSAAVTTPLTGGRVSFAIPWHEMLLLGTTDEPFEADPGTVAPTADDERQILREAAVALDPDAIGAERVLAAFAGLRALPVGTGSTESTRRETVVTVGSRGMVSVAGGKLTTWRRIGVDVATRALEPLGISVPTDPAPLSGAADPAAVAEQLRRSHPALTAAARDRLAGTYGSLAHEVLEPATRDPSLLESLVDGAPELRAEALHAVERELATSIEDIARRRTSLALRGLQELAAPRLEPFLDTHRHAAGGAHTAG